MQTAQGNHIITGSLGTAILRLAGPMFVAALLQNLQSLIDLFWVGRLGSSSVAALALSGTLLMMTFPIIMGTATGTVALVSRRVGAGQYSSASETAAQSLVLAMVLGVAIAAVGFAFAPSLCRLLGAAPDVTDLASSYLRICFLGSFTVCLMFIGNSVLRGAGNAVIPMCVMLLANLLNIVLDPLLIFGLFGLPRMEIQGAAVATVLSQAVAAAVVIAVITRGVASVHVHAHQWRLRVPVVGQIVRIGLPSSGQMLSRCLMALVMMRIVARSGTAAMAAFGIGIRFHMIVLMPAFALANAVATMVGQNLGAGKPDRAQRSAWLAAGIDAGIMLVAGAVMVWAAPWMIAVFDSSSQVVRIGTAYLRTVSPWYLFAALAIILGRAMNGAGHTVGTMAFTIISLWGIQVPLAILLSQRVEPATQGVWWAMATAIVVHGLLVTAWFTTGRWKRRSAASARTDLQAQQRVTDRQP